MFIAYAIVAIVLALSLLGSSTAKLTKNPGIVKGLGALGISLALFPFLAALEVAGAVGLILGLWVAALGIAAAVGVVVYFAGAVATHLRAGNRDLLPPIMLGLLAAAALVLRILSL